MKLTVEGFMDILTWVSGFYTNFNFKLKDSDGSPSVQFNVWYEVLSEFDEDVLMGAVKIYCKENVYPPSSPAQLLSFVKEKILKTFSVEMAFEDVVNRIRKYGYDIDRVADSYQKDGNIAVSKTVLELRSNFRAWFNDGSNLPYLKKDFVALLQRNFELEVTKSVSQGRLEASSVKLLGE